MVWNLKKGQAPDLLQQCIASLNCWNRLERKVLLWGIVELGSHYKNNFKNLKKSWNFDSPEKSESCNNIPEQKTPASVVHLHLQVDKLV